MARRNTLQYMILGLLTRKEMTGYDIKQTFDKEKAEFWSAPFSQIYPELNRMLTSSLIELAPEENENSRKKTYQISDIGQEYFRHWLYFPLSSETVILNNDDLILRLHFLGEKQKDQINQLLEIRIRTLKMEVSQLELELAEVINYPEQLGRKLIIEKELVNKKVDIKLWNKEKRQ